MEFIGQYQWQIIAALAVLALLLVVLLVWRTVGPGVRGRRGQRLGISEYHELDKMRRLVLVRRDNVEHLILIGGGQDLVVESRISQSVPSFGDEDEPRSIAMRAAPRPPVFGDRRAPTLAPARQPEEQEQQP